MKTGGISDEALTTLNAYLDGQLRSDEIERLEQRLQKDAALQTRLDELKRVGALVRQGFGDTRSRSARARRARPYAVAAALLIGVALGWALHAGVPLTGRVLTDDAYVMLPARLAPAVPHAPGKVLVHLDSSDPSRADTALRRIEVLLAESERQGRPMTFELVVNSTGLELLRADASPISARIGELKERHRELRLVVCRRTLAGWRREHGAEPRFLPGVVVGPPAIDHIIDRMQHGWTYVRI